MIEQQEVHRLCVGLGAMFLGALCAAPAGAWETSPNPMAIVSRSIVQDHGDWQIDYRLHHGGATGVIVTAEEVMVRVEGWVSNSRAAGHAGPRWSSATVSGPARLQAVADVIESDDEEARCRERVAVSIWVEDGRGDPSGRALEPGGQGNTRAEATAAVLSLAPGVTVRFRLRLEHQHAVFGTYDPLLGQRTVELRLGTAELHDVLPLDQEQHVAQPHRARFELPEEHRDTQYYRSAPDSLHVAAHLPGNAYHRFAEIPVRYDTRMRLRFSYLVATGTEGTCKARITQFKDSPVAWRVLADGRRELPLSTVGRWTQVELVFRTEPRATTLSLDFRIEGDAVEAGEFWVDDLSLEPVGAAPDAP